MACPTLSRFFFSIRGFRYVVGAAYVVLCAAGLAAQTRSAVLEGTVHDSSGGVIAGAEVRLRDPNTNQGNTLLTDDRGRFRAAELPVGTYEIRVEYQAFAPYQHAGLAVAIGQTVHLDIELTPAGIVESVGVSAQPPPLNARQTAIATAVDTERIEELPVRSRNYLEFVLLAPGVAPSPSSTQPGAGSTLPDSGFSFAGLRPRSNLLTIDGLDNNDEFSGASRTELSLEIVREFQVVNNGWSAENGGASGGAINVVTKSGANTIHGDAFLFGQSGVLNARPALKDTSGVKPSLTRYRAGLALGGPVVKDRTFYYAAAEQEQTHAEAASDIDPQAVSAINATLAAGGFPKLGTRQLTAGVFPTSLTETEWSAKVTDRLTARDSLIAGLATTNRRESADAFNAGGLTDLSARGTSGTRDLAFTSSWTSILGSQMTNDLRGQVATRRVDLRTTDQQGPGVLIPGVVEFGRPYAGNSVHDQMYVDLGDTFGFTRRSHFVKAGVGVRHVALNATSVDGLGGVYVFRSLNAFLSGQPGVFRQMFGDPTLSLAVTRAGVFVQDQWTPQSGLTIDAGARYDVQDMPSRLGVTNRQFSPRLGVAWAPNAKWVIRGGAGTFADRVVLAAFERAFLVDGRRGVEQIVSGPAAATLFTGAQGGALASPLAGTAPSIYTVRSGRWNPSSRQATLGVERELMPNLTMSVNYLFVRGHNLTRTVNVNVPPPTILTTANAAGLGVEAPVPQQVGRPVFGPRRLDPAFNDIFELQPTASSTYRGVTVTLNRRLASEIAWSAAYTWSHTTDTASDFDEQPQNPWAVGDELSDSRYDQRHRVVASALFDLPIGEEEDRTPGETPPLWVRALSHIDVALIVTLGSGRPLNPLTGGDDNGAHAWPVTVRPLGAARNSLRLPFSAALDLRVLKYFRIKPHGKFDLVVEAFNLLNRVNITQVNTVYGPLAAPLRGFGRPIEAATARRVQMSIDFEF